MEMRYNIAFPFLYIRRITMYNKILGGLIGGASGDAIGAATEGRTTEQILKYFGHRVVDFEITPLDTFGAGNCPGQLTDDFSSAYFVARHIVDNKGIVDESVVKAALIEWSEHHEFFDRFAGPTTRLAIKRYKGEFIEKSEEIKILPRQATNGGGMKISPIGLMNPGNIDKAIQDAVTVTMVTHDNHLAISGACAVAAATSYAMKENADVYGVLQAGLYGAKEGEYIGKQVGQDVAGPSVVKRMEMAIDIGLGQGDPDKKMVEIAEKIGTGLHVSEAIPAAFGFFTANKGEAMGTIISAVNAGYDTDTIATIAGAIAETLQGAEAFPEHFLPTLESANHIEIRKLADDIYKLVKMRAK